MQSNSKQDVNAGTDDLCLENPHMDDRNFDDLVEHFAKKVYGSRKGKIRLAVLWRDIKQHLHTQPTGKKLKVLDMAGGLGQLSTRLAALGHEVIINDISENMLNEARQSAQDKGIKNISYIHAPYQDLPKPLNGQTFDLILCHALLEWLAEPKQAIATAQPLLAKGGTLSLCFYNPVAKIYRNLIMGNFYNLDNLKDKQFQSDKGSLTPNNPCSIEEVTAWLSDAGLTAVQESGVRVFSDYVVVRRGGHENLAAVIEKELHFSQLAPYKYMGRYFHMMCHKM